jgi:hypothetical protein
MQFPARGKRPQCTSSHCDERLMSTTAGKTPLETDFSIRENMAPHGQPQQALRACPHRRPDGKSDNKSQPFFSCWSSRKRIHSIAERTYIRKKDLIFFLPY